MKLINKEYLNELYHIRYYREINMRKPEIIIDIFQFYRLNLAQSLKIKNLIVIF